MSETKRGPFGVDLLEGAGQPSREPVAPASSSRPPAALVGRLLGGKYELVKLLATGSMGHVFEARHRGLQRGFAVKVLHRASTQDEEALYRFRQEAVLASAIGHENIVDVVDIDRTDDDQWYIVMELLRGVELRTLMFRRKTLSLELVVTIARQLGSAVDAAHARGILHRDLKPENIFVLNDSETAPTVKIVDFGISKVRHTDVALTRPGEVIGTPFYMAPEQARGDSTIDQRADLFALGAVFYEALTGCAPFSGDTPHQVLQAIVSDEVPPASVRNPVLSPALDAVLAQALAKDRDARYQSGAALAEALACARPGTGPVVAAGPAPSPQGGASPLARSPRSYRGRHLGLAFLAGLLAASLFWLLVDWLG